MSVNRNVAVAARCSLTPRSSRMAAARIRGLRVAQIPLFMRAAAVAYDELDIENGAPV